MPNNLCVLGRSQNSFSVFWTEVKVWVRAKWWRWAERRRKVRTMAFVILDLFAWVCICIWKLSLLPYCSREKLRLLFLLLLWSLHIFIEKKEVSLNPFPGPSSILPYPYHIHANSSSLTAPSHKTWSQLNVNLLEWRLKKE